jgi:hypothetical protein
VTSQLKKRKKIHSPQVRLITTQYFPWLNTKEFALIKIPSLSREKKRPISRVSQPSQFMTGPRS